jgi:hypothetical protein
MNYCVCVPETDDLTWGGIRKSFRTEGQMRFIACNLFGLCGVGPDGWGGG